VRDRIADRPARRIADVLPWHWKPLRRPAPPLDRHLHRTLTLTYFADDEQLIVVLCGRAVSWSGYDDDFSGWLGGRSR
jgi:hypothetical protein